jgi:hypothetical protein
MKKGAEFLAIQNRLPPPSSADAPALRSASGAGRPGRAFFSRTEGHELAMGQRPTAQDEKDFRPWPRTALSRELILVARRLESPVRTQAAVAARQARMASSRKTRSVRRDVRWRWTLKVFWTAA